MKKKISPLLILMLLVCIAATSNAAVIVTLTDADSNASNTDLLQTNLAGFTAVGTFPDSWLHDGTALIGNMGNDGIQWRDYTHDACSGQGATQISKNDAITIDFANPSTIYEISMFIGHKSNGRNWISDFTVEYEQDGNPGVWNLIVNHIGVLDPESEYGKFTVQDDTSAALASNVTAVKITWTGDVQDAFVGLSEIDVIGTAPGSIDITNLPSVSTTWDGNVVYLDADITCDEDAVMVVTWDYDPTLYITEFIMPGDITEVSFVQALAGSIELANSGTEAFVPINLYVEDLTNGISATAGILLDVHNNICEAGVSQGFSTSLFDVVGGDCIVNELDLAQFATHWLEGYDTVTDLAVTPGAIELTPNLQGREVYHEGTDYETDRPASNLLSMWAVLNDSFAYYPDYPNISRPTSPVVGNFSGADPMIQCTDRVQRYDFNGVYDNVTVDIYIRNKCDADAQDITAEFLLDGAVVETQTGLGTSDDHLRIVCQASGINGVRLTDADPESDDWVVAEIRANGTLALNAPQVDIGDHVKMASGDTVMITPVVTGTVTDFDWAITEVWYAGTALLSEYANVDDNLDIQVSTPATENDPFTISITKDRLNDPAIANPDEAYVKVQVSMSVNGGKAVDSMTIDVYDDRCAVVEDDWFNSDAERQFYFDINGDCMINMLEFAAFAADWMVPIDQLQINQ